MLILHSGLKIIEPDSRCAKSLEEGIVTDLLNNLLLFCVAANPYRVSDGTLHHCHASALHPLSVGLERDHRRCGELSAD